jgi:type II secretory pathway predicted ATPase ExeA
VLCGGRGSNLPKVKDLEHEKDEFLTKKKLMNKRTRRKVPFLDVVLLGYSLVFTNVSLRDNTSGF